MFDVADHLDGLRCRPTEWLVARREGLVRDQRRLRVEELAVTRVLDDRGVRVATGSRRSALSAKITRAVLLRDGHCGWPGCERRTGLQVHHLEPRSWGGSDDLANLAAACTGGVSDHHVKLVPHGPWMLVGNPNQPDGLRLIRREDHSDDCATSGDARAGPPAA